MFSCYHIGAAIIAALVFLMPYADVANTPLAQLTINMMVAWLMKIFLSGLAIWLLIKSVDSDKIWPWNWSIPVFIDHIFNFVFVATFYWIFLESKAINLHDDHKIYVVAGLLLTYSYIYLLSPTLHHTIKTVARHATAACKNNPIQARSFEIEKYVENYFNTNLKLPAGLHRLDNGYAIDEIIFHKVPVKEMLKAIRNI